jgi:pimeloyl-ACP methyl ester carboxylesterase
VRQQEVARAGFLLAAFVLLLPVVRAARVLTLSALFIADFLGGSASSALSRVTVVPLRQGAPHGDADRYVIPDGMPRTPLVLVHGLAPDGKDDERLVSAATLLARVGFDVAVPTIPGLTRLRLRPGDVAPVATAIAERSRPSVVVGVSVGAGVALLAAAAPDVRDRVALVVSLGGYASAADLVRFYLTGEYGFEGVQGRATHDPALIGRFLDANADLLDPSARRVLAAADPAAIDASMRALSPELRALLAAVSPVRVVAAIPAPIVLVHGRGDGAVPYTESLRLAAARPVGTRVVLVGLVGHVEGITAKERATAVVDLVRLVGVAYRLIGLA